MMVATEIVTGSEPGQYAAIAAGALSVGAAVAGTAASLAASRRDRDRAINGLDETVDGAKRAIRIADADHTADSAMHKVMARNYLRDAERLRERGVIQYQETDRIRRLWFILTVLTVIFVLGGAGLALFGIVQAGIFTALSGIVTGFVGGNLYLRLNKLEEKEEKLSQERRQFEDRVYRINEAREIAQSLEPGAQQSFNTMLALSLVFDNSSLAQLGPALAQIAPAESRGLSSQIQGGADTEELMAREQEHRIALTTDITEGREPTLER